MKKILSLFALMLTMIIGTAQADYYVGEQISPIEVEDGDLVILEASCSSGHYGRYLSDGTVTDGRELSNRSAARIYTGLTDAAVWRVVSSGAIGKFYLQSVSTGYYYSRGSDLGRMTDDFNSAEQLKTYVFPDATPYSGTQRFTDYSGNPAGWNTKSFAIQQTKNSYYLCSDGDDMIYGDHTHARYWNMFRVSTNPSKGTAFSAFDGTRTKISGVTIDGLTYDLTTINTPSGGVANFTTANRSYSKTTLHIPATVTYNGKTYRVNRLSGGAFQGATFTNIEFESPIFMYIGSWAFAECNNVTEIVLPEGITFLPNDRPFSKMNNLETVTFPSTIRAIEDYAFAGDPKLTTLIFKGETPPMFKGGNLFGETTVPGNITVIVPSEAAVAAYTTALASYPVKEIITDPNANGKLITDLSQISDDKYYFIISQFDGFRCLGNGANAQNYDGKEAAMGYTTKSGAFGSLENYVSWVVQKRSEPDANVVMKITKNGSNWNIQNVGTGKYVGEAAAQMVNWADDASVAQAITPLTDVAGLENAFYIHNAAHADNRWKIRGGYHGNSADAIGSTPEGYNYGSTAGYEGAWKIYELSDVQVQALAGKMITLLTDATEGVGYVNGYKNEASRTAVKALLAGNPTYGDLLDAYDNDIMHLTDGYYRLSYPKNYQGVLGEPFVFFDNAKLLFSNLSVEAAKADYSTVYKVTVEGGVTRPAGSGYTVVMESQGVRPYYNGSYSDQKAVDANTAKAWLIRPTGGFDDGSHTGFAIEVSQASGSFHGNYYLCKTKDAANNPIAAYYAGGSATKLATSAQGYLYPATDITITMHEAEGNYWATLYVPFGVTLPEGTAAYVGNVDTDGRLKLTSLGQNIPAGTPVIVCGDAASVTATINDEIPAYEGTNGLKGQYLAHDAASDNVLTLGKKDGKVGFYAISNALDANKAYLAASTGAKGFQFVFDDDDITGINDAQTSNLESQTYFDLQGRKVAAPQKGSLYIKGGKVVKF